MAPTVSPAQIVTSIYEAFQSGDIPRILAQVAPGAKWRQSKSLPWGGDYTGPEGAGEFFRKLNETMETIAFDVQENIEHGDEVFSFGSYTARSRKTGRTGTAEWMFRWRAQGGKIVSWESYIDSAPLVAALA
jgi:ketosteroid isomerase-like protein